ncbi:MAG: class D sortase, partial [Anaerotignum sp.]|nr:class D sortase [Anaerotignum sp.]
FALVLALIMLTAFSLLIISTALNKKNIKLDLFAFDFNFGKLKKGRISDTKVEPAGITAEPEGILAGEGNNEPPAASADFVSAEAADTTEHQSADIVDMNDLPDMLEGFDEFEDFDDLEEPGENVKKGGRAALVMGGMKDRFAQAQNDAQAKAIEREAKKMQEDLELYDPDETMEEIPEDFGGKLRYWWRNHFGFRIGICAVAVFLIFAVVFYGYQMRGFVPTDNDDSIVTATDEKKDGEKTAELDPELEEFRQTLDGELAPVDVDADSLDEDPNLAEIVTTAQRQVGNTPATYTGSHTTRQPSGSIGTISIPSINLKNAPVMGSVELSDLSKGTGHFENTPVFDGNVGIAGHNNTHFKYLVNVDIGDQIQYTVNGVTRTYQVTDMRAISDTDWGVFTDYGDNRLTLVTCEHLVPNSRIAVTAIQVGSDSGRSNGSVYTGKVNSSFHQDSGDYHDAGSGYTDYIGVFTGNN